MIAVAPGYDTIGIYAPLVLILARLLQSLSMGGEYGTSATYLTEIAPPARRGFYLGFLQVSIATGQLIAFGIMLLMQHVFLTAAQIENWGWRIAFLIGGALSLFGLYMRQSIVESDAFERSARASRPSLRSEIIQHWRTVLIAMGMTVGGAVAYYTYTTYMQKFLINSMGLGKEAATLICSVALLFISAASTDLRTDFRPCRQAARVDLFRRLQHALFRSDFHSPQSHDQPARNVCPGLRGACCPKWILFHPHAGED